MKKCIFVLVLSLCLFQAPARAHVLISDDTNQIGAVLHITPDDDPIAGEPSTIFFDIQNNAATKETHSFTLTIIHEDGTQDTAPISVSKNTITSEYVFPSQAVYTLLLSADPVDTSQKSLYFRHAQRVSRGIAPSSMAEKTYMWAEVGVVGSLCGLIVLGIITFNRKETLAAYIRSQNKEKK